MGSRGGQPKRVADVPVSARVLVVSKADLLELAWELAGQVNMLEARVNLLQQRSGSGFATVNDAAIQRRIVDTLNDQRARRGAGKVKRYGGDHA